MGTLRVATAGEDSFDVHGGEVVRKGDTFTFRAGMVMCQQLAHCFLAENGIEFNVGVTTAVEVTMPSGFTHRGIMCVPTVDAVEMTVVREVPVPEATAALRCCTHVTYPDGTQKWFELGNGVVHRENDKPAVLYSSGAAEWRLNGVFARVNKRHTAISASGVLMWKNAEGQLHSVDNKYALLTPRGTRQWFRKGVLHNDHGPAEITTMGTMRWFIDGKLHRVGGYPAVIHSTGSLYFFENGELHRDNALPAIVDEHGSHYWLRGQHLTRGGDVYVGEPYCLPADVVDVSPATY